MNYLLKYTYITPIKTIIPRCIGSDNQLSNHIFLSPHKICAFKKRNNYKFDNINYNYISISNSHIRNTLFFNTKINNKNNTLNNSVFLCVCKKNKDVNHTFFTLFINKVKNLSKNTLFSIKIMYNLLLLYSVFLQKHIFVGHLSDICRTNKRFCK